MIEISVPSVGAVLLPGAVPITGKYAIREARVTIEWDDGITTRMSEAAFVQLAYSGRVAARPDLHLVPGGLTRGS